MAVKTVGIAELCRLLAGAGHEPLTEMAVSKWVKEGMPKASRGQYDPHACMFWYIGKLRTSTKRKEKENADGSTTNLEDERRRLIAAQADNEEMTAAERRGELMPVSLHESRLAAFTIAVKFALQNLPDRLAGRVENLSRVESKALIKAAVNNTLGSMSAHASGTRKPGKSSSPSTPRKAAGRKSPAKRRRGGK